ncbi:MAG: non-canonical purine NTP pyrophosphatase [Candidatus Peribacteria bacterium]|nr:MAG: non-canonical purine NTP pyrophosphatase [Candidatus Peribacteria bacterium]
MARDVIGYCNQAGEIHYVEGIVHGQLVAPKAPSEFGRDAIFQPDGYTQTYADMPKSEKNQISHRRKAIDALQLLLQ